ncbi:NADH-dependent flavin oxidoreductase nadA [Lachnellula hyalina]|uniref:NADH-dependent flavin oxidoreductase nadA n=1 Tax=Lachnellula hyalina TaxID=1316788 RepID=A0A8H8R490_9HELO|nr:NADH-dependent flavin oxidoreductase nadA [Lachnellula hyalina]TVY28243.1 NADH-dependent flavin oxidoreductase nadA [Lachnellula hyalina]
MNFRTDEFGGSPAERAEIVLRIIRRIRAETSPSFTIGIKLNSVDASASSLDEVMTQISLVKDVGINYMEISGGSYEDPDMMKEPDQAPPVKKSTLQREAFFLTFAQTVRSHFPALILMASHRRIPYSDWHGSSSPIRRLRYYRYWSSCGRSPAAAERNYTELGDPG